MTTLRDTLTDHAADVLAATSHELAGPFRAIAGHVHPFVRHTDTEIAAFLADGDHFSGGYCAADGCGRFVTAPVHVADGEVA